MHCANTYMNRDVLMFRRSTLTAAIVAMALTWLAAPASAQEYPFEAVVEIDEKQVEIRSGASMGAYPVGVAKKGDRLTAHQNLYGWYQVDAPTGTHSYVEQAFVEAKGDGSVGVVTQDKTKIRAAAMNGDPGISLRTQVLLSQGDQVKIVEEVGDYFKILPPNGARVWMPPNSIRRVSLSEQVAATETKDAKADTGKEPKSDKTEKTDTTARAEKVDTAEKTTDAATAKKDDAATEAVEQAVDDADAKAGAQDVETVEAVAEVDGVDRKIDTASADVVEVVVDSPEPDDELTALEDRLAAAYEKPLEQRPLDELLADYEKLAAKEDLSSIDRRIVDTRIAQLKRDKGLLKTVSDIQVVQDRIEADHAAREAKLEIQTRQAIVDPTSYHMVGLVLASKVFDGETLPRLYRVADPATRRTLAYLQPSDRIEPSDVLGKVVGINGETRFDHALKLRLIDVDEIAVSETN